MANNFFLHPVFQDAIADIESLGVQVHRYPTAGAKPYAVIGGRTNARWWLIPLDCRHVTASGLALFQPLLRSARALKSTATYLSLLGLSYLWVRNKIYISGTPLISAYFPQVKTLTVAYFTGTDSPHRKLALQIMDGCGDIKGFAKISQNPELKKLLAHEATILKCLEELALESARTPKVLYFGEQGKSTLLVTDTLKTRKTKTTTQFSKVHQMFIKELSEKTITGYPYSINAIGNVFREKFNIILPCIEQCWKQRLDNAISLLEACPALQLNTCLSHGDFTPWNTFLSNNRLYVFDWEYAKSELPASNDLIHYILNQPNVRNTPAKRKLSKINGSLANQMKNLPHGGENSLIIIYLLTISLRHIEREAAQGNQVQGWDGAREIAELIDAVVLNDAPNKKARN